MKREGFSTGFGYVLMVFLVVALGIMIFLNFRANTEQRETLEAEAAAAAVTPTPEPTATPEPTPTPNRITETVTLVVAGDIVGQPGLSTEASYGDGEYDFFDELEGVTPALNGADYAACTIVGTVSTTGPYDEGYHMPNAIATALAGAGFQLVNAATDHILDRGLDGLTETVTTLRNEGLYTAGAYSSQASHGAYMTDVHGVKIAFLSYTCGTGGVSVADNSWCVDILTRDYMTDQTTVDYDRVDADIAAVREAGADIVVCFVYWWENTQLYTVARDNQTAVADRLLADGVDILIGGGVKTPQPIETRTVDRGDGTTANCVVCYSLSNMLSCYSLQNTNLSAAVRVDISRDASTGESWVSCVSYEPLFMLDTGAYEDYENPGFKYRLLDAYDAMDDWQNGSYVVSDLAYEAIVDGVNSLRGIIGAQYDAINGGVEMECPF